jgi:hypothetical protein
MSQLGDGFLLEVLSMCETLQTREQSDKGGRGRRIGDW